MWGHIEKEHREEYLKLCDELGWEMLLPLEKAGRAECKLWEASLEAGDS